jgi:extracellular factor (EF) 3-hydroxypalmitic acid methyl ester biosynthesis protein
METKSDDLATAKQLRAAGLRLQNCLLEVEASLSRQPVQDVDEHYGRVRAAVEELLDTCRATGLVGAANALPSSEMWAEAGGMLGRGWLLNRARQKPRGYAGDYELLGRMYENWRCDDPVGGLLDRYFQEDAAPVAVRNRMELMRESIVASVRRQLNRAQETDVPRGPLKVAIVGSAFGLEVRDALMQLSPTERASVAITLLDLDPAATDFARGQLAALLPPERLVAAGVNVFRLPQRPTLAEPLAATDILFCPGIFDYLDDAAAADMLALFWRQLAPGGQMTVLQFAPHNPSRALMEWIGNWYLIYRNERQLRAVTTAAGIPGTAANFGAEPQGVDLYVTARKGWE